MVIIWDKNARNDLKQYMKHSKIYTKDKLKNYINDLINYIDTLIISPYLGKSLYFHNSYEVRQLIYKMHRIFYYIKEDKIIISAVFHMERNVDDVIENINEYIK